MANILGSLRIELTANTAKFVDSLSKAAYSAQQSARNISREFDSLQKVASQTFGAFGSLNPVISQISFALSSAGRAAASAMRDFGSLKSGLGAIGAISAGAVTALAGVSAGAVAITVHAAESAAKLYELSQSTGVGVESLSGLSFAAKAVGVDLETLAKGLERMDRSALAAAQAPRGTVNAYTQLGVSVRDAGGNIRPTADVFEDLAQKFRGMPDGVTKTALAISIFGRSGAELIPVLNQGSEAIKNWLQYAQKVGALMTGENAEAAHHFGEEIEKIQIAITGLENKLMQALLPALTTIADKMADFLATGPDLSWVGDMVKQFIAAGADIILVAKVVNAAVNDIGSAVMKPYEHAKSGYEHYRAGAGPTTRNAPQESFSDYYNKVLKEHDDFISELANGSPIPEHDMRPPRRKDAATTKTGALSPFGEKDVVGEAIEKLQAESSAQLALAAATDRSTAAMLFQKAAAEANSKIAEIRTGLLGQEKLLEQELANARASGKGVEAATIQARIAGVQKELSALSSAAPQFQRLYAEIAAAKASEAVSSELTKKSEDFGRQITALKELASAYQKGGAAVASAGIDKELQAEKEKIEDMRAEYARLQSVPGIAFAAKGQGPSPVLADLAAAIDAAEEKFSELEKQASEIRGLEISTEIGKLSAELRGAAPLMDALNRAYLENETAVRQAQVALELYRWTEAHPGATAADIAKMNSALTEQSEEAHAAAIAQAAEQYEIAASYQNRIQKLEQIRELIQSEGKSTLLVDAAIYDEQKKQVEQWDQAAKKVGTFTDRMRAAFNELALQGEDFGKKISDSILKAVDGVEGEIAHSLVTGKKANFTQIGQQLEESFLKATLQRSVGTIAGTLGIKIPGLAGKRGESAGSPLFVSVVNGPLGAAGGPRIPGLPSSTGSSTGVGGSIGKILGAIFGGQSQSAKTPPWLASSLPLPGIEENGPQQGVGSFIGSIFKNILGSASSSSGDESGGGGGSGFGSILGSIFKGILGSASSSSGDDSGGSGGGVLSSIMGAIFGGFRAGGGDVTPGKAYVVGEKRPEIFVPHSSGSILPSTAMAGGGATTHYAHVEMHIHGVSDVDSFQRSRGQIAHQMFREISAAGERY